MTDAADDTFAGLTDYVPVYEMDVAAGALELGFGQQHYQQHYRQHHQQHYQ